MTTPTHMIIAAGIGKGLSKRLPISRAAFVIGAGAPDLALILLHTGAALYYWLVVGSNPQAVHMILGVLYDTNPVWIVSHNLLHAPLLLLLALASSWSSRDKPGSVGGQLFWFFLGAALHTATDIPTHTDDGPLLLFPFDWTLRFNSPISWWETPYFKYLEGTLDIVLLAYLFWPHLGQRRVRKR